MWKCGKWQADRSQKGVATITATSKSGGFKAITCTVTVRDAMADDLPGVELK